MQVSSRVLLTCTYSVLHEETGRGEKYNVDKADDDEDDHTEINTNSRWTEQATIFLIPKKKHHEVPKVC